MMKDHKFKISTIETQRDTEKSLKKLFFSVISVALWLSLFYFTFVLTIFQLTPPSTEETRAYCRLGSCPK
jgi:hypothetical protein